MKRNGRFWFLVFSLWFLVGCDAEKQSTPEYRSKEEIQIIPQPQEIKIEEGFFEINKNTTITTFPDSKNEALYLKQLIENSSNFKIDIVFTESISLEEANTILLFNQHQINSKEAYQLTSTEHSLGILSMSNIGLMNGIQTLRQLFINDFHSNQKRDIWYLPTVTIKDSPKFKHRGLLLDCSRHFYKKEVIKKYIDLLALYKMNVLHWHLTEDQGWRIAIDKYPKLTEIGAWRTELDGSKYGGFYTKSDIRKIVAYATERHITVIPEIELPGHSQAAIAAYPYLSCTGEQIEVANDWGVFKEIYCAGNDSVFTFLEDVLTEVMELFPSKYIHIGGDEAPKFRWEHCDKCQQRIKDENITDEHGLQSYFISRIEKFLNKNGRQLIGWDEILEGGLSENATVQSWRGMEGGITAANSGHNAIMSPTSYAYFDYDLKAIDLEKVYNFDPIPKELAKDKHHFIIGGECNMWTEHVPDENNLDSKVFPRLLAMSEVLWSYPKERNYAEFYNRLQHHYPILKSMNVNYGAENLPIQVETIISENDVYILASPGNKDLMVYYKWECDTCNDFEWAHYEIMLEQSGTLIFQAFKNDEKYEDSIKQTFEFHNALTKKVTYKSQYNQWYTAGGDSGLVDSKTGSLDFRDGNWQGFWGNDAEMVLDLGKVDFTDDEQKISEIAINFYQYNNSWIFFPTKVEFAISSDGKYFETVQTLDNENIKPQARGKLIETFRTRFERQHIRYIKVKAINIKKVPDWHEAAGSKAWIFMDEIIVR